MQSVRPKSWLQEAGEQQEVLASSTSGHLTARMGRRCASQIVGIVLWLFPSQKLPNPFSVSVTAPPSTFSPPNCTQPLLPLCSPLTSQGKEPRLCLDPSGLPPFLD